MSISGPHRSVCAPDTSKAKHLLGSSELICELRTINPPQMALSTRADDTFTLRLLRPTRRCNFIISIYYGLDVFSRAEYRYMFATTRLNFGFNTVLLF